MKEYKLIHFIQPNNRTNQTIRSVTVARHFINNGWARTIKGRWAKLYINPTGRQWGKDVTIIGEIFVLGKTELRCLNQAVKQIKQE